MALTKCPERANKVSGEAPSCPKCGKPGPFEPLPEKTRLTRFGWCLITAVVAISSLLIYYRWDHIFYTEAELIAKKYGSTAEEIDAAYARAKSKVLEEARLALNRDGITCNQAAYLDEYKTDDCERLTGQNSNCLYSTGILCKDTGRKYFIVEGRPYKITE